MMEYLNPVAQYVMYFGLGFFSAYVRWQLKRDVRKRRFGRVRRDRREADRILEMKLVPERTILQIAMGVEPRQEPGRHRVRFAEPPPVVRTSLLDRWRETMEGVKEAWHGTFHGPIRTPETVAAAAYARERGPGGLHQD